MSDRENQVTAVKAIQKFLRVYEGVVQAREAVEGAMVSRLGRVVRPRPLTRSLPLTAKPELDADLLMTARIYRVSHSFPVRSANCGSGNG